MFGNKERNEQTTTPKPTAPAKPSTPRNTSNQDSITAYLGPDIEIEGTLRFENSVLIEGRIKGTIESEHGTLVVGESAVIEGDVTGGNISIRGKVEGSVTATERVHLQDRGVFIGEVSTPSLQMDESVTFDGSCKMGPNAGQTTPTKAKTETNTDKAKKDQEKILNAVDSVV